MTAPASRGGKPLARGGKPIHRTTAPPLAPQITTTTLPQLTEDDPVPATAVIEWVGGTAPFTITEVTTVPGLSVDNTSSDRIADVTGSPTGSADTTITIRVTDANGLFDEEVIDVPIDPADTTITPFVGYWNRHIGFAKNQAVNAQIGIATTEIQNGTDRLRGGLIRYDCGGNRVGGASGVDLGGDIESYLTYIDGKGVKSQLITAYTHANDQRTLTFSGSTSSGNLVVWNGGTSSGLTSQMGVPGHRPTVSSGYYGPGGGSAGLSVHGPGIAYLRNYPASVSDGGTKLTITLPTGDNPGAGASWAGCGVQGGGIQPGTKITGTTTGGLVMDKPATATRTTSVTIGIYVAPTANNPNPVPLPRSVASQSGTGLTLVSGVTAGRSGTYRIGGTNSGCDIKMTYRDLLDCETVNREVAKQAGARCKCIETWNELSWSMGARPRADVPHSARMLCHAWVGAKLGYLDAGLDPDDLVVALPGPGHIENSNANYYSAPDWYDALLDFWLNDDPDYFTDLCAARGLTKTYCPKVPGDTAGIHPYGDDVQNPAHIGMNQLAYVFNAIGAATGEWIPMQMTEQGLDWNRTGSGALTPGVAYTRYTFWLDAIFGEIAWPYNTHLTGPCADVHLPTGSGAGQITLANRRAAMRKGIAIATFFALREPANAGAEYGILFDSDGNQKYQLGTNDPLRAFAEA